MSIWVKLPRNSVLLFWASQLWKFTVFLWLFISISGGLSCFIPLSLAVVPNYIVVWTKMPKNDFFSTIFNFLKILKTGNMVSQISPWKQPLQEKQISHDVANGKCNKNISYHSETHRTPFKRFLRLNIFRDILNERLTEWVSYEARPWDAHASPIETKPPFCSGSCNEWHEKNFQNQNNLETPSQEL